MISKNEYKNSSCKKAIKNLYNLKKLVILCYITNFFNMENISSNNKTNLEIKYKEYTNDSNKETVVILHWWWGSSNSWIEFSEILSQNWYNVIVPDLPWFWETKLNYVFDLDEYSKVITNFLRELKIDNFILWWHSNWWAISIKIANSNIFNIKRLVLNNSAWIRNDKKRSLKRKILNNIIRPFKFLWKSKKIRSFFYRAIWSQDYLESEKTPFLKETYKNMISSDLKDDIKKINLNTLLIWWELDSYTPLSDAYYMRNNIWKSKLVVLDWETHWIHIKNPVRLVDTFINNI